MAIGTPPTSPNLPPGVSEQDLAKALDAFTAALGAERVLTGEEDLRAFRDPFAFSTWDDYTASAVLMPETVEEIQAIVRIANEHRVPLWTHGQGRNNGYGGPAPRVRGSVIVSLRNMNKVLEINEDCAYAVVEPGVRWFDLYEAIVKRRPQADGLLRGPRLGQRDRQHARPRRHLHAAGPRHGRALRDGGRAPQRRAHAHRHGRHGRQQGLARLQAQPGPLARPDVHAVQPRDRHEDGLLADALPGVLHAALAAGLARRRPRPGARHPAPADARRHHPHAARRS